MRSSLVNVALTSDRDPRRSRASGGQRLLHLTQVRLRLDDQQVDASLRERDGLLPVRRERVFRFHPAVRSQPHAERADRSGDEAGAGISRERRRGAVQLADARGQPVHVQAETIATERVREDHVGSRVHEGPVDGHDPAGVLDVQQLEAGTERFALFDQRRAHAAVGQERSLGDERPESRAVHPDQCRRRAPTDR